MGKLTQPPPPQTRMLIIPVLGATEERLVTIAGKSSNYEALKRAMAGVFDEPFEHVAVLFEGNRRDMFVGETSSINGRHIRNIRGTAIYRNNALTREPGLDPESIPAISGPVVLFPDRIVWT
ncbi:protein of unknown function [Pseudorhizobium banfieldiae]|uniref:Uncharacterized protein n=1 Tax=Pseudorhizobium banfieldiae TaxID=1125847 RepID=L0NFT2_9HYPH|nr:hypothetical protein [Pseudorhizobium banfieldiae]CAD6606126.1 hypothetical protein RNT25_01791 [arsenite-oxidising bacterium NT-25]CCF19137.1 protein of unknown function [Pseudorhizobium banfieldiae]